MRLLRRLRELAAAACLAVGWVFGALEHRVALPHGRPTLGEGPLARSDCTLKRH